MKENKSLFYKNKFFQYELNWKNIKKINLKISDEGKISVSAPFFVTIEQVEFFLYKNINFIEKNLKIKKEFGVLNIDLEIVSLFGTKLKIIKYFSSKNSVRIEGNELIIDYKNIEDIKKLIKKFLKKYALPYFKKRLDFFSIKMNIPYNKFKIKWLKTKWGHCNSNKEILLNYKLISYDKKIIDYVIIHELSHIVYMNHSISFWNLVGKYCPDWKLCKNMLKM